MRATETNVLNFVGGLDKVFIIPPFQRNYEWTIEQCRELFDDVIAAYKTNSNHYLGNVVYYPGENSGATYTELILVDGQQRVTTILLLLCAIREVANDEDITRSINRRYLKNDTSDEKFRIRLKQTSYDRDSFSNVIDGNVDGKENTNIKKNYEFFVKRLQDCDVSPKNIFETMQRLEIVDVNLQIQNDLSAVQTVFEKINSTGKQLEPADLIRNFLLLCNSSDKQDQLYENYWVKIEKDVSNERISRFAKDYLVMNIFDDVPEKKIYKMFKEYVISLGDDHERILREMCNISEYYAWISFAECPDKKLNRELEKMNILKTFDVYPLTLYLFVNLYQKDMGELRKILKLISDFMLRYRIASFGGGGGTLRTVIQSIIEKMSSGEIETSYDSIYYELSNSSSPLGRFPSDKEFSDKLMSDVNVSYAKVLLLCIEEHEKSNIPVDIAEVTVEHLMPQTLNKDWREYLGGKEEAERIHSTYLNSIGNLAPISQSYNSKNSNKKWDHKVQFLKQVQFFITSEVADEKQWKEKEIQNRSINIAKRACKAVTGPLERTRKYQTKKPADEFESGIYPISDVTTPMTGAAIQSIIHGDETVEVDSWRNYLSKMCEIALKNEPEQFKRMVEGNVIHKASSTKNYPDKDPIVTKSFDKLVTPIPIGESNYYSEGCVSSERSRYYANQIMEYIGDAGEYYILVEK